MSCNLPWMGASCNASLRCTFVYGGQGLCHVSVVGTPLSLLFHCSLPGPVDRNVSMEPGSGQWGSVGRDVGISAS